MKHFISMNQLSVEEIYSIISNAEKYRMKETVLPKQLFAGNLFFEPSTRTKMSFVVAERKLGMEVLDFHMESSSVLKGESLYDTAKTFEAIGANLLVIRDASDTWFEALDQKLRVPVINAGAGKEEHPSQCMLDLHTIYQEYGRFRGLNVVIVGDIKHSRVARSNANALKRLGANVFLSAAPEFIDESLEFPYITMDEAVKLADVVMLLRIQHERHEEKTATNNYLQLYGLTKEREKNMKQTAIIMHPAPINRGVEIDSDLVECSRSRIFKQMENGVYIRMAIIKHVLQEWGIINETATKKRETTIRNGWNGGLRSIN